MFGRKKKQETEDPLGLSTIGSTANVVPAGPATPPPTEPSAPAPVQPLGRATPTSTAPGMTFNATTSQTPMAFAAGMQGFGAGAVLRQMLGAGGPIADLVKEIQANPQAFREKMIAQMQAAGVSTYMMTPQGYQQLGAAAGAPSAEHVDVIEELTKAADLHDKGALTDAEFEALKHKLLGH
jgi:hypothetical protein